MSITGHTTLADAPRYTAAEQTTLAQAAISRLLLPAPNVENAWKTGKPAKENAVFSEIYNHFTST